MVPVQAIGKFYDGKTGQPYEVMIGLSGSGIRISCTDGTFETSWSFNEVLVLEDAVPPQPAKLTSKKDPDARLFINPDHGWIRIKDKLPRDAFPRISLPDTWKSFIAYIGFTLAAVIFVLYAAPEVLERSSVIIPESFENTLGEYVVEEIVTEPLCVAPKGRAALDKIIARLENETQRGSDYKVYVMNMPETLNALAAPGAHLILFSGVIERAEVPEEVAGILAHEMAHIELYHPTRGLMRDMGLSLLISMMTGSGDVGELVGFLARLSYSRSDESDADKKGREILAAAQIDPRSLSLFFEHLIEEELGDLSEEEVEEGLSDKFSSTALTYLSTHPRTEERINESNAAPFDPSMVEPLLTDEEFQALKGICNDTQELQ